MKLFEVKDVIREHVGRDKISEPQLDWCVQRGLREIEKHENFYWMEASQIFDIYEDQQEYKLKDIEMEGFKESEILLVSDRTADDPKWDEIVGPESIEDTKPNFTESDAGQPAFFTMREEGDNPSILLWPPLPAQDYRAQWYYYKWTSLPTSGTSDAHEVLRRWPEALIYLATEQAMLTAIKDPEAAMYWKALFLNANPQINTEYKRIKLYQDKRHSRKHFRNSPASGQTTLTDRIQTKQRNWF